MSLLGAAVGKERFFNDAKEAIEEILKTPMDADDLQREYIKEASQRICKTLKADFKMFLPHLLPGIFKTLDIKVSTPVPKRNALVNTEEDIIEITTGEGKLVKVHTSQLEELVQAIQLLRTYCNELAGSFYDYVPQTAQALLPVLSASDEISHVCEDARSEACETWSKLIKVAKLGAEERNQPAALVPDLLRTYVQQAFAILGKDTDQDPDLARGFAEGLASCLRNASSNVLNAQEILQLVQLLFKGIDLSFHRTLKSKDKDRGSSASPDEDDEDQDTDAEELCRRSIEEALGAIMEIAPQEFLQCMTECNSRISQWLATKEHRPLAFLLAGDVIQHLKEQSTPSWPVFMPSILAGLVDENAEVRIATAYSVGLAAPLQSFAPLAQQAFQALAGILRSLKPKKHDKHAQVALDNAVQAMFMLVTEKADHCPPDVPAWGLIVSKLPLRHDEEEARKIHKAIADLVLQQHQGLLGAQNANIGQVLSALAEVYKQENLCTKETDELIFRMFQMLPRESLVKLAGGFTQKQQRKIEKMLSSVGGC